MCFVAFYPVRAIHLFAMKLALKKYDPWYVDVSGSFLCNLEMQVAAEFCYKG